MSLGGQLAGKLSKQGLGADSMVEVVRVVE